MQTPALLSCLKRWRLLGRQGAPNRTWRTAAADLARSHQQTQTLPMHKHERVLEKPPPDPRPVLPHCCLFRSGAAPRSFPPRALAGGAGTSRTGWLARRTRPAAALLPLAGEPGGRPAHHAPRQGFYWKAPARRPRALLPRGQRGSAPRAAAAASRRPRSTGGDSRPPRTDWGSGEAPTCRAGSPRPRPRPLP